MKNKIWAVFTNTVGGILAAFGGITMGVTFKLYDNYNLAAQEFGFYKDYKTIEPSIDVQVKNDLSNLINLKYANLPSNVEEINFDKLLSFKTFNEYLEFLKNKENSFIYNKQAWNQIQDNIKTNQYLTLKTNLINTISTINDKDKYFDILTYLKVTISHNYYFDKTPENVSMIFGILFLVSGFVTIMIYWVIYIAKLSKKQENEKKH